MTENSPNAVIENWLRAEFSAGEAQTYIDAAVPLAIARQWKDAGLDPGGAVDLLDKSVPLEQVMDLHERGIEIWQVTQTETGYEVALEPWQEDPLAQLPDVIEPGHVELSLWSVTPWDDSHLETEVSLHWNGEHTVSWSTLSGSGLSMMSEVGFRGMAGWPDGVNLLVCYSGDDGGRGFERLAGAAPTASGPDGVSAPQRWVEFAESLVDLTEGLLNTGIEPREEFVDLYRRRVDDEYIEFDGLFTVYLTSSSGDKALPDFDDWINDALEDGTYEIVSDVE